VNHKDYTNCPQNDHFLYRLFQMTGPATTKLLIPSVVVVLGTGSNPVRADRKCLLPVIGEIARHSSAKYHAAIVKRLWCHTEICISDTSKNEQRVDPPSHLCSRSTSFTRPRGLRQFRLL